MGKTVVAQPIRKLPLSSTRELRQLWSRMRAIAEPMIREWTPSSDLIHKLSDGTLRDSRVEFFGALADHCILGPIAKARVMLIAVASVFEHAFGVLGGMQQLQRVVDEDELDTANEVYLRLRDCIDQLKISAEDSVWILGMAAENLEYDWPNGPAGWRRNLSPSNNLGEFFTPLEVMSFMVSSAFRAITDVGGIFSVIDPFGGIGTFPLMVNRQLDADPRFLGVGRRYTVIERNPLFAAIAADLLFNQLAGSAEVQVFDGDSLLLDAAPLRRGEGNEVGVGMLCETADLVITNPPYARMKFHRSEFEAKESYLGEASTADIEAFIHAKKREISAYKELLRSKSELAPAMQGEWDLYRLGLMRCLSLIESTGVLTIITPCSVLADYRCSRLREYILRNYSVKDISLIGEGVKLFPTVNQPTAIYTLCRDSEPTTSFCSSLKSWEEFEQPVEAETISNREILDRSPFAIPLLDKRLIPLYRKLFSYEELREHLVNGVKRGELDLTAHKQYLTENRDATTLIRGDNIERYSVRCEAEQRKLSRVVAAQFLSSTTRVNASLLRERRLVGRQCSYMGKKRRLSWVVIEGPAVVSNSCNYIAESECNIPLEVLEVVLNSSLLDWFFRTTSTNNHVGNYQVEMLPLPEITEAEVEMIVDYGGKLREYYRSRPFGTSSRPHYSLEREVDEAIFELYEVKGHVAELVLCQYYPTR